MSGAGTRALIALVPVLLIVGLLVPIRRRPDITVTADSALLRIRLGFWDKLYCVHGDVEIPTAEVEGVAAAPLHLVPRTGLRLPGTRVPRVIRAGSYGRGARRDFWDIRNPEQVLVISLRPGSGYRRLVLEVPDPHALALELRPALGAYTGAFR